jgi:glycosyltransferase involved in cell wall biosynthesis
MYNAAPFLRETVESILNQTYTDFKFLIIDNASTDNSRDIIRSYNDPRIELVPLPENIGQVAALNKGLDMIDTLFIARMDADDICLPQRFERQVEFMGANPEIGICGTFAIAFHGKREISWQWPTSPEDIKVKLLFECCLAHPSVMIRKDLLNRFNLRYSETIGHSFDWELWQRAAECFPLANIPAFLLRYRLHEANESKKTLHLQEKAAQMIDNQTLERLDLANHPLRPIHRDVAFETMKAKNRGPEFLAQVIQWFDYLEGANLIKKGYNTKALRHFLNERLFLVLKANLKYRRTILKIFFSRRLCRHAGPFRTLKFMIRILLRRFVAK